MRKTLRVPDPASPTPPPGPQPGSATAAALVPWAEVRDAVGDAPVVVRGPAEALPAVPEGWSVSGEAAAGSVVVVVDPAGPVELAAEVAAAGDRPIVLVTPNVGGPSYARALLVGGDDLLPGRCRLGTAALDRAMAEAGRVREPAAGVVPEPTGRPFDDLLALVAAGNGGHDRPWAVRRYDGASTSLPADPDGPAPFLSVLVRTQGRRPDALGDVLLCLGAQTCDDLEVLLLAHDVEPPAREVLDRQVADLPTGLRGRVRVVPVAGGGRSRPLTVGTRMARGAYIAVLDDDDLVLAHWAEAFETGAREAPGLIQRAVAVEQDVEHVAGPPSHRATSWPKPRWDREFSLLSHVVDNHSPIHS